MPPHPAPTTLGGRYTLQNRLDQGGMGEVYEAQDARLETRCAIKLIRTNLDPRVRPEERLGREARHAARIVHQNVVRILDYGFDPQSGQYLVMEFIPGQPLQRLVRQEGGHLSPRRSVYIVCQLLSALTAVHAEGIVHRDIKPGNVMVLTPALSLQQDTIKLLDFGISRADGDDQLTEGVFIGSSTYAAPEQLRGDPQVDHRADLYAAGTLLHYLLTGQHPYPRHKDDAQNVYDIQKLTQPAKIAQSLPSGKPMPGLLLAVLERALQQEPHRRFGSAQEMLEALRPYLAEEEELTLPEPLPPPRPERWMLPLAGLLLLPLLVLTAALGWQLYRLALLVQVPVPL